MTQDDPSPSKLEGPVDTLRQLKADLLKAQTETTRAAGRTAQSVDKGVGVLKTTQIVLAVATVFLVLSTIAYTWISWVAKEQATQHFLAVNRPWVAIRGHEYEEVELGKRPRVSLRLRNSGQLPAICTLHRQFGLFSEFPGDDYELPAVEIVSTATILPSAESGKNTSTLPDPITEAQMRSLEKGEIYLLDLVLIEYTDPGGVPYVTKQCLYYNAFPETSETGTRCPNFNYLD